MLDARKRIYKSLKKLNRSDIIMSPSLSFYSLVMSDGIGSLLLHFCDTVDNIVREGMAIPVPPGQQAKRALLGLPPIEVGLDEIRKLAEACGLQ